MNVWFLTRYWDWYRKYAKHLYSRGSSFSRAVREFPPFVPDPAEIALERSSKKVHSCLSAELKPVEGVSQVALGTIAILRAMARDLPEFRRVYKSDLRKIQREMEAT
jgi:hypothetical protein